MKSFSLRSSYVSPVVLMLIASLAAAQAAYKEMDVKNGGTIRGKVLLSSKNVRLPKITINKDSSVCGNAKDNPTLIVGKTDGVKNAIVYLEGISQGKKMGGLMKPELDQSQCEYEPHVLIVSSGCKLNILNSDAVLHSVHAYDLNGAASTGLPTVFNIALPVKGLRIPKQMASKGLIMNLCDAGHPWMNSYVMVATHPYYALTDAEGNFALENVPAGTYTIKMWHEPILHINEKTSSHDFLKAKETVITKKVTVKAGATATMDFELTVPEIPTSSASLR